MTLFVQRITVILLIMMMVIPTIFAQSIQGSGTEQDPYLVPDVSTLVYVSSQSSLWGSYFEQTANVIIDPAQTPNFAPIGNSTTPFTGTYDGKDFSISNLTINLPSTDYVGLFGSLSGASIRNLTLINASVTGDYRVGALIGFASSTPSVITNCNVSGTVSGNRYVGGFIGRADAGQITWSSSASLVSASNYEVGGFIGYNKAAINYCYATGNVSHVGASSVGRYGGFAGISTSGGWISDSYSTGTVDCNNKVFEAGGFIGNNARIANRDYSTGKILNPTTDYGGLMGKNTASVGNCFWDTETSQLLISAAGTGKTTSEMKTLTTFTSAGWNFTTVWSLSPNYNDGYPNLDFVSVLPITWNGSVDSDWSKAFNWTPSQVPSNTDDVIIPAGLANYPIVESPASVQVKDLSVLESGVNITVQQGGSLIVTGVYEASEGAEVKVLGAP